MINYFEALLLSMRPAFSRKATFAWFVIAAVGFIMRTDTYGVSSIIRAICLTSAGYPCLLHFFHSSAWNTKAVLQHWWLWLLHQNVAYMVNDRIVLTGDHTKNVKDGRRIPEVETLHQDSETSSKPSYFRGHHWGFIGLLTTARGKFWSTPLWAEIHRRDLDEKRSTRIVTVAKTIVQQMDTKGYLVLDAFFAVGPVFQLARKTEDATIHIVTRAKKNVTAYLPAKKKKKGTRGRAPMYGKKLKLMKLFDSKRVHFSTVNAEIYGTPEKVRCLVLDLLWKPIKSTLRFILIESSHGRIILITTDHSLSAVTAITLYCKRASIETLFNSLKNLLNGLGYHFWSKYLQPSSRRPAKKDTPKPVSTKPEKTKATLEAIEKFVVIQIVVLGALQLLAFRFPKEIIYRAHCYMRTPPKNTPSEFMTKTALINITNINIAVFAKNMITQLILEKREKRPESNYFQDAA